MKRGVLASLTLLLATVMPLTAAYAESTSASGEAAAAETVCLQCHGGQAGRLGAPVSPWRQSIHAKNGISCHDCHGGDPADFAQAMSPERGFLDVPAAAAIADFCGRCHVGVREDYLASAHGRARERGPHCVTCHGSHTVQAATLELINAKDCSRCHEFGRAGQIKEAVAAVDARILAVERDIAAMHRIGFATRELQDELFNLRNAFHRLFHTVDVNKVRKETEDFSRQLDFLDGKIAALHAELQWRQLVGSGVILLLLAAGVLLLLLRKTYADEERGRKEE
ncbi:MAG: hypothetical protein A2091_08145 [Desulfuromonadales bacterium GWD2_61_12]|nr:MAG: hypothetical protein A2005_01650 [Desulfuromonadales bacterium GWC2_61_20]OGR35807.1 MAG: hypothetical protein A2091_08145 [Desulfuromonadales bacterium GWD2_61_12]HAD04572.1 cytochrome C [Desulfuromonas sp.]HBT83847.1 cytochrome C [Desulfuromonas sp.]